MRIIGLTIMTLVFVVACSSKPSASESAKNQLENKFSPQVGKATKSEFVEYFGNPEWCRMEATGEESCRFYKKVATKWMGENKRDKKSYETFDEVVADFDSNGKLKAMKVDAQR